MKTNQQSLAKAIGISQGHLSRIMKKGVTGRRTGERLAALIGGKWTDYVVMKPEQLERVIRDEIEQRAR
jgi:transcriptional regulator with XRE-family HTH domain